jgi:hypothetical protein
MNHLVVGSSSQLSRYFPDTYHRISSRNIDLNWVRSQQWDSVYICYAEQRTYIANADDQNVRDLFWKTNYDSVLSLIDVLVPITRKIVYYSTAELWNQLNGPIDVSTPFRYHPNHYTDSKRAISDVLKNKDSYPNVSIAYPFNFNSVHRGGEYLFGKVFRSIVNNQHISVGDLNYYRELLHPSMLSTVSIAHDKLGTDFVVGTGRLVYVQDFIRNLYSHFNLDYCRMVSSDESKESIYRTHLFYAAKPCIDFSKSALFDLTVCELSSMREDLHHEQPN